MKTHNKHRTFYRTLKVDDLDIFYREAGSRDEKTILLLHGFPTSSHMFRNLIQMLSDQFHLVAPDYPGTHLTTWQRLSTPSRRSWACIDIASI